MRQQTTPCRYRYDALDRLATRTPVGGSIARSFYQSDTLASEIQDAEHLRFLHHDRQLLATQSALATLLIGSDQQHSVLHTVSAGLPAAIAYTPYGHRQALNPLPGFNGERPDPLTGHYLLGNGYRAYNPVLMRFNSPDSLSPFGNGGVNAYGYCAGDPVNRSDPTGHGLIDDVQTYIYLGTALVTGVFGLLTARSSIKAVIKGVKLDPEANAVDALSQTSALRRPATTVEKVSAAIGVGALIASATWTASYIAGKFERDSLAARTLRSVAIVVVVPVVGLRGWTYYRSRPSARAAKKASMSKQSSLTGSNRIRSSRSSIRSDDPEIQNTHL
ncbi:RHS repeat-associated core domain-containing protein [Pseudomonas syringae]|uniref:RHS repeat-associated core domain-containing protein n=1 Tax=Pseudomonas syringae UB303 TaxID=1357287 RepID=A0AAJ4E2X5_PSESX|nr:RHS repeat-associated core domain-containing protein [Pseudomonas syringae]MCH5570997.1 RHS repeat-associated core domain-containing protein [Pseudomonas syringae pv. syringae]QHF06223.1 RHS repeat-associated core domain-containing protein [Pseudomonas syringae UB303]